MTTTIKTVLFVPGFQEDLQSRDYAKTIKAIENCGYKVKFVNINWLRTTIDDWVTEFNKTYDLYKPEETILAGFSFGATTVFTSAVQRNPYALWLFSLSPFFAEDIQNEHYKKSWVKLIGHRRESTFKNMSFNNLVKKIDSQTVFFYGDLELKEWTDISYREDAMKDMPNVQTTIISGAGHDVTNDNYIKAIIHIGESF